MNKRSPLVAWGSVPPSVIFSSELGLALKLIRQSTPRASTPLETKPKNLKIRRFLCGYSDPYSIKIRTVEDQ
jgi:hypothetical protein